MHASGRAVLDHLIDYAGLFPPAGLGMPEAVANFAGYLAGPDRWALGRFVVPAARLSEYEAARAALARGHGGARAWPLSVLVGADAAADLAMVAAFRRSGGHVVALEARVAAVADVGAICQAVPSGVELYVECAPGPEMPRLLETIAAVGARAKIRMGGVRAEEFPSAESVGWFLAECAEARVAFKATAGLHHPVRASYPLTYEPGSACGTMFGYLNLALAATLAWHGEEVARVTEALLLEDGVAALATDQGLSWGGMSVSTEAIARTRAEFLLAIGSCSFTEPLSELRP